MDTSVLAQAFGGAASGNALFPVRILYFIFCELATGKFAEVNSLDLC
jgi:hypothetical protein